MGHSYNKAAKATNIETPKQWTDLQPHKYCKRTDWGRSGRPNKAQKCDACQAVKASMAKASRMDTAARRQEKISWEAGGFDDHD